MKILLEGWFCKQLNRFLYCIFFLVGLMLSVSISFGICWMFASIPSGSVLNWVGDDNVWSFSRSDHLMRYLSFDRLSSRIFPNLPHSVSNNRQSRKRPFPTCGRKFNRNCQPFEDILCRAVHGMCSIDFNNRFQTIYITKCGEKWWNIDDICSHR